MFAAEANTPVPRTHILLDSLGEEAGVWLFVFKTLLAFYITGWLAMRFSLSQPWPAILTTQHCRQPTVGQGAGQEFLSQYRHARRRGGSHPDRQLIPAGTSALPGRLVSMDRRVCRWRHLIPELHLLCVRAVRLYGSCRRCSGHR